MSLIDRVRKHEGLVEGAIVALVFAASAAWGTSYWNASWKAGRVPQFYQINFEPAVMIACHHGFVVSSPQPQSLGAFLQLRTDTFACGDITPGIALGSAGIFQGAWRYLMFVVGFGWRWLGISWSGMGPLFGVFFGLTIAITYGIFRLAVGRWLALAGAIVFSVSTQHLVNLPHLRDYSKAPFTLALIFLLGLLVTRRFNRAMTVGLSALYGLVLGVGYGFRTDLLADVLPILVVLFLFLDGGIRRHLRTKLAGAAAAALVFLIAAWPIFSAVYQKGGGQWHVVLLGLTTPFDAPLRIAPAPYDWGHAYADGMIYKTSLGYASRVQPASHDIAYGGHEYDVVTGAYLREIVSRFPADMVTRAFASSWRLAGLPFETFWPPLDGFAPALYRVRWTVLVHLQRGGSYLAAAAILAIAAYELRVGFFLLFCLLYFGGYPAIQFSDRHYFHFEFIGWWSLCVLIGALIHRPQGRPSVRRAVAFVVVAAAVVVVPLSGLRIYQQRQVRGLMDEYITAPKTPISLGVQDSDGLYHVPGPSRLADVRFIEIDLNGWMCGARGQMIFRYDRNQPNDNYSRTIDIPVSAARDVTRVFAPIYAAAFQGVEFRDSAPNCLAGAYWVDTDHRPLLLSATLAPEWQRRPLYQRLRAEPGFWQ